MLCSPELAKDQKSEDTSQMAGGDKSNKNVISPSDTYA